MECIHSEGGQILIIHLTNDIYRKYHSGWMCTGATRRFAAVKLSGCLKMYGSFRVNAVSIMIVIANPKISFTVK